MTLQTNSSNFRISGPEQGIVPANANYGVLGVNGNISDYAFVNLSPVSGQRTLGATLIDIANLTPTLTEHWSILSVTFQIYLAFVNGGNSFGIGPPSYNNQGGFSGKLGRIFGAILFGSDVNPTYGPTPNGNGYYVTPMLPLPLNAELMTTLYDPSSQALPPITLPLNKGLDSPPIQRTLALDGTIAVPIPRPVTPGSSTTLGVGIWMEPSIYCMDNTGGTVGNIIGLAVCYGSYTINYDNGL